MKHYLFIIIIIIISAIINHLETMGANQSTTNNTNISNKISIAMKTTVSNAVNNEAVCDATAIGDQTTEMGECAEFNCGSGSFNIDQDASITIKCIQNNKADVSTAISNDASSAVTSAIQEQMEQALKGLDLTTDQHIQNNLTIATEVEMSFDTTINNDISNTLNTMTSTGSTQNVVFNGKVNAGDGCDITQKTVIETISEQICETVIATLSENSAITTVLNDYKLTIKQSIDGFDFNKLFTDFFDAINKALGGLLDNFSPGGILSKLVVPLCICVGIAIIVFGGVMISKAFTPKEHAEYDVYDSDTGYVKNNRDNEYFNDEY